MNEKSDHLPRVKGVKPGKLPWTLEIVWHDGSRSNVDLTGLVHRSRHFRRFLEEPLAFRKVRVVEWGAGIGWDNGLDYSADTLKTMAEEQQPLAGKDLQAFEAANKLNTAEMAALLDVSERTIREYRAAVRLPQPVALALRAMLTNTAVLDAHYRPADRRPRGRPRKSASA
jgi:DNA-binding transcriptional regulator YiaG